MTLRWRAKRGTGRWEEQEPLPCDLQALLLARDAVRFAWARHLIAHGETATLGICHRTFAVVAAERAGRWPLPGIGKGFDEILFSYAIYLPIEVLTPSSRWRKLANVYDTPAAKKLRAKLFHVPSAAKLLPLHRITHLQRLRPSPARLSAGAWYWNALDPAGAEILGSCYPLSEVQAADPSLITVDRVEPWMVPPHIPEVFLKDALERLEPSCGCRQCATYGCDRPAQPPFDVCDGCLGECSRVRFGRSPPSS